MGYKPNFNFTNADRGAREGRGFTNVAAERDPFWFKNPGMGQQDGCTKWLPKEECHDEWTRVLAMRANDPSGSVAGGRNSNSDFVPSYQEDNERRWEEKKELEKALKQLGYPDRITQSLGKCRAAGSKWDEQPEED